MLPHPHIERRYLLVPGLKSSRIYIFDTHPDPRHPQLVKTIEAEEIANKTGYSRPHTLHCGPDGIYCSALGDLSTVTAPVEFLLLTARRLKCAGAGRSSADRSILAYDFWWHLGFDTLISSEWGTPNMVENGVSPDLLLSGQYGHHVHLWDLRRRKHLEALDLGAEQQMVLELRPAHDPTKAVWICRRRCVAQRPLGVSLGLVSGKEFSWGIRKVIEIPAEPADADKLPPALKPFGAVPPLITDINLSLDDQVAVYLRLGNRRVAAL